MYTTDTPTNPLLKHPLLAFGSIAILGLGLGLALLGMSFYVIGFIGALTAERSPLPATSVASVVAERGMLYEAGLNLAIAGVPFMLVGILFVAIVWLVLD